jgi:hypothetical protein
MINFPESDWKILSQLKPFALDRLCKRHLGKATITLNQAADGNHHAIYLQLSQGFEKAEKDIDRCFNDWRRSTAIYTLANWRKEKLLTDGEYQQFSKETQANVNVILSLSA